MRVYRTKGGYFYKELKNGKKTRISKDKYLKLKGNKHKKMKGGQGKVYTLGRVNTMDLFGLVEQVNQIDPDSFYVERVKRNKKRIILKNFWLYTNFDDGMGDYIYMKKQNKKQSRLNNWESCWFGKTPFQMWEEEYPDNPDFPLIGRGYAYLRAIPFSFQNKLQFVTQLKDLVIPTVRSNRKVSIDALLENHDVLGALTKYAAYILSEFNQYESAFVKSVGRNSVPHAPNSVQAKINLIEQRRRQSKENKELKRIDRDTARMWERHILAESEKLKKDKEEGPFKAPSEPGESNSSDSSSFDSLDEGVVDVPLVHEASRFSYSSSLEESNEFRRRPPPPPSPPPPIQRGPLIQPIDESGSAD